jgi:hypothetical protein
MGRFSFFWNRSGNKELFEFQQNTVLNQQNADAQEPADPYEAVKQAERERAMLSDEKTMQLLLNHPELHAFIPALAPVNRTTKHISKTDARVAFLDWQILVTLEEMCMPPEKYEAGALEIIQGLEMQYNTQVSDGWEGWKGRILTEQKKTIATEFRKGK